MKFKEFSLSGYRVIVVDAPKETTHSLVVFNGGAHYVLAKKSKQLLSFKFDGSVSDTSMPDRYKERIFIVGKLATAHEAVVGNFFTPVRNGNFIDFEVNGIFYPKAVSALMDLINQDGDVFENPFVLAILE